VLCAIALALLASAAVAGVVQSLRVEHCLPTVDFLAAGAKRNADRLISQREYDRAIAQLELQSRIMPYDAGTYEDLGNLLGEQARPEAARAQFQMLVALRPDYAEGYNALGAKGVRGQ
jgi:tetratricopeptide (TPR) repeat protein